MILLGINERKIKYTTSVSPANVSYSLKGHTEQLTVNCNCLNSKNFTISVCFSDLGLMYSILLTAYMNVCSPLLGQFLRCGKDFENEHDVDGVAI